MTRIRELRGEGIVEVHGRWCGSFADEPALAAEGVNETVVATVTEFMKAVERG